jgi:hypothetical protein
VAQREAPQEARAREACEQEAYSCALLAIEKASQIKDISMAKGIRATADAVYVALSFQDLYAPNRQVFAIRFVTDDGKKIIVELPGQGAKFLLDKMKEAFDSHPEMAKWGKGVKTH